MTQKKWNFGKKTCILNYFPYRSAIFHFDNCFQKSEDNSLVAVLYRAGEAYWLVYSCWLICILCNTAAYSISNPSKSPFSFGCRPSKLSFYVMQRGRVERKLQCKVNKNYSHSSLTHREIGFWLVLKVTLKSKQKNTNKNTVGNNVCIKKEEKTETKRQRRTVKVTHFQLCISESDKMKRQRHQWIFPWQQMMTHWWHTEMITTTHTHRHSPGLRFPLEQALSPPLRVGAEMVGQLTTNLLHCPERVALLLDTHVWRHTNYQLNYTWHGE